MVSTLDNLIPPEETRELKQALHGSYTRYDEYSIFNHVDLNRLANPVESVPQLWSLYLQLHSIFASLR
jgi:hypothetical protein